jgi:predicted dehydrogenase
MVQQIRVALIGGGGFMGKAHSMAYALAPHIVDLDVEIVTHTLVDANPEIAASAAARLGWLHSSADWRAVIESDEIDVVDIVTPPQFHQEIATAALAAGKPVFCEKPITNDADEAERMAAAADAAGLANQVGFNYRHTPAITHLKKLIDAGDLGAPLTLRATYMQDGAYFIDDFGWRATKRTGGSGAVGDIGSHVIDLAEYLNGPIVRVAAAMATNGGAAGQPWLPESTRIDDDLTDDAGAWIAQFANGSTGTFSASFQAYGRKNQIRLELDATKGAAEFDWNRREEIRIALASDDATDSGFKTVLVSDAHQDVWYPVAGIGLGYVEGSAIQLARFVEAAAAGGRSRPDFADAAHVQRVVAAIQESARSGAWVDVPGAAVTV